MLQLSVTQFYEAMQSRKSAMRKIYLKPNRHPTKLFKIKFQIRLHMFGFFQMQSISSPPFQQDDILRSWWGMCLCMQCFFVIELVVFELYMLKSNWKFNISNWTNSSWGLDYQVYEEFQTWHLIGW